MLIDKGVTAGEVVTIRLNSGEEVVAKLITESEKDYKVVRPMVLSMGPQGIGMIPLLFTVDPDKEVKLMKQGIFTVESTDKRFADQYVQSTTGIALR